jgi:hypothetical protein
MSQPNFQAMGQKELHNYVLAHRDDQTAFYAYVDRVKQLGTQQFQTDTIGRRNRCSRLHLEFENVP